ncbi:DNA/RNA non-specific endonuclease [Pseudoalteromonas sp. S3431]|uniref:DNA/RNA non-specific endonuclease n=1 Tax=Pseudoalteromonas sp. S3431 TaxID=579537 RepID=UPI00049F65E6|nr:DNA/RNA non-specific endonuclease [Pseudoalteromonas sp. S3431]KDC49697.1 hypothetical protein DO88_18820 [Pseudoalteromonas sp. S3431]
MYAQKEKTKDSGSYYKATAQFKPCSKKNVIQRLDLSKVDRSKLNFNAQSAFDLLDNNRANFKKVDKSGGDVNAVQDSEKRVTSAYKVISNVKGGRSPALQSTIGWLGNLEAENINAGHNGGHLIADSLGGSGTWQNMVPQDGPENKWGDWRKYERENKKAMEATGDPLIVRVQLGYTGDSVLPTSWKSQIEDKNGKDVSSYSA